MLELLKNYSLDEIAIFVVMLGLAIKGFIDFWDWAKARIIKPAEEKNEENKEKENMEKAIVDNQKEIENLKKSQKEILRILNILVDSDRDDIKAWITEKHHYFCYNLKYVDDYSLQCLEARYKHYKDENGNTFIDKFMTDIRALPVVSVADKKDKE